MEWIWSDSILTRFFVRCRVPGWAFSDKELVLEVDKGEFVLLVGENGIGKTTFLRAVAGVNDVFGEIECVESKIDVEKDKGVFLGFVWNEELFDRRLSVQENLELCFGREWGKVFDEWKQRVGFDITPSMLFGGLSRGERILLELIRELEMMRREGIELKKSVGVEGGGKSVDFKKKELVLFVDEAFGNLSEEWLDEVLNVLKERYVALVLASHNRARFESIMDRVVEFEELLCYASN